MATVVVVDDSQFMRVQIRKILEEGGHTVVADAENGKRGIEAVREHRPDVVTMDVKMPGMGGIGTVRKLMTTDPTPVLMLSRYTEEGAETTLDALDAGAIDFMLKPDGEVTASLVEYADDLVELVKVVAEADVGAYESDGPAAASTPATGETPNRLSAPQLSPSDWEAPPTLFVAASTGGPSALQRILGTLPANTGIRVVIVQHMPAQFTDRFANRLNDSSAYEVYEPSDGDRVGPNEVVIAPGGFHLEIARDLGSDLVVSLTEDPPVHSVRPAADVTLESGAKTASGPLVGVVLSGMGNDGAVGAEWIADAGGTVLAQDPETASIGSMPEHAIETGVVDEIHHTAELPEAILDVLAARQAEL
jgi:two-component system chemotaxis response regulator CheB